MYVITVIMSTTFAPWVGPGTTLAVSAADYVAGLGWIAAVSFASQRGQITATHSRRSRMVELKRRVALRLFKDRERLQR
jgi:hypothetical protein